MKSITENIYGDTKFEKAEIWNHQRVAGFYYKSWDDPDSLDFW